MPEISNDILDDGEEFDIGMSNLADAPDLSASIKTHMATFTKNLVPKELRKQLITKYVEELNKK